MRHTASCKPRHRFRAHRGSPDSWAKWPVPPPRPGASELAAQRQNEADWFTRLTQESTESLDTRDVSGLERDASRLAVLRWQFREGTRITATGVTLALVEEQEARVQAALDRKAWNFHAGRAPGGPWPLD